MARNQDQYERLAQQGYLGEEIITGEGVALELPPATAASRIVAGAIDWFVYLSCMLVCIWQIVTHSDVFSFASVKAVLIGAVALWVWIVPMLVTGLSHGSSLGKLATRTRVVRSDGGVITMRHAAIRATAGIFEIWVTQGMLAFVVLALSKRGRRIGDMLADTYVVRWPKVRNYEVPISMPDSMLQWAEVARTREIPGGLTLNIITHFKALPKLTPQARAEEARMLAAAAERYVSPAPAWGTPPEDFLAALIVLRNQVENARAVATRERHERALAIAERIPYVSS